jgi:hypothetical protein
LASARGKINSSNLKQIMEVLFMFKRGRIQMEFLAWRHNNGYNDTWQNNTWHKDIQYLDI